MSGVSHRFDGLGVVFDDESFVADAGLVAAGALMGRLGVASLVDAAVRLGRRAGACATPAHNLYRWLAQLAKVRRGDQLTAGQTVRNRLQALPGRLVNHSGRTILRLPARWPWATTYHTALTNIRALPQLC
ncbi:MAG: hypothetical protein OXE75_09115 [bacterium]|nr:hypothetical protein [bacterium]